MTIKFWTTQIPIVEIFQKKYKREYISENIIYINKTTHVGLINFLKPLFYF